MIHGLDSAFAAHSLKMIDHAKSMEGRTFTMEDCSEDAPVSGTTCVGKKMYAQLKDREPHEVTNDMLAWMKMSQASTPVHTGEYVSLLRRELSVYFHMEEKLSAAVCNSDVSEVTRLRKLLIYVRNCSVEFELRFLSSIDKKLKHLKNMEKKIRSNRGPFTKYFKKNLHERSDQVIELLNLDVFIQKDLEAYKQKLTSLENIVMKSIRRRPG